jgi:hypothetical protein
MSSGVVSDESGQSRSKVFSGESRPELSHINDTVDELEITGTAPHRTPQLVGVIPTAARELPQQVGDSPTQGDSPTVSSTVVAPIGGNAVVVLPADILKRQSGDLMTSDRRLVFQLTQMGVMYGEEIGTRHCTTYVVGDRRNVPYDDDSTSTYSRRMCRIHFTQQARPISWQYQAKCKTKLDVAFVLTGTLNAETGIAALRDGYCR